MMRIDKIYTGCKFACVHPKEEGPVGKIMSLIRWRFLYDHISPIYIINGQIHIIEASHLFGGVVMKNLDEWLEGHKGVKFRIYEPIYREFNEKVYVYRLKEQIGKKYDVNGIVQFQMPYQLLLMAKNAFKKYLNINLNVKWFGYKKDIRVQKKWYCTELDSFAHDLPNYYEADIDDCIDNTRFMSDGEWYDEEAIKTNIFW